MVATTTPATPAGGQSDWHRRSADDVCPGLTRVADAVHEDRARATGERFERSPDGGG